MIELIILVVGVLVLSAFFAGSEASLLTLTEAEVEAMAQKKKLSGRLLKKVFSWEDRYIIAIVILNNIVNIVGSIAVGQTVVRLYGNAMLGVTTTALTFGLILFSEVIPKSLGVHYAHRISPVVAPIVLAFTIVLMPLIVVFQLITNLFKGGDMRKVGTEEQIRSLATLGRRAGHIEGDEGHLVHRAFILNDKTAGDIMTPLKDIIGVSAEKTVEKAWEKISDIPHSRFPVFGASMHEIEGMLLKSDVLEALYDGRGDQLITEIMRDALVVLGEINGDDLIRLFRDEHKHLAVVQDAEHTVGLVTFEDVLEELVGEIEDETDVGD